ncbi:MAG: M23 family metallopeptidase [Parvibaculales bacterium]
MTPAIRLHVFAFLIFSLTGAACFAADNLPPLKFPAQYVADFNGQLTQGGFLRLQLKAGVELSLNDAPVDQIDGLALIGFGRDAPLRQRLRFHAANAPDKSGDSMVIELVKRDYRLQYIDGLPPQMVTPPDEAWPRIRAQSQQKRAARAKTAHQPWMADALRAGLRDGVDWPVIGRVTGVYGSQRFYNRQPRRPHFGIDIAAPKGTPIRAPMAGEVTLSEPDMYFEGGLIFIHHGLGLTSAYMHLDSLFVRAGDQIAGGQIIGTVGSTGRSTGPHLDWRLFWRDQRLDPQLLAGAMPPPKSADSNAKRPRPRPSLAD